MSKKKSRTSSSSQNEETKLINFLLKQNRGAVYDLNDDGLNMNVLNQEIEKNELMFKSAIQLLVRSTNTATMNTAIMALTMAKKRFFLLYVLEKAFMEMFANAKTIKKEDLMSTSLTGGGRKKRKTMKKNSASSRVFSWLQFLLMLLTVFAHTPLHMQEEFEQLKPKISDANALIAGVLYPDQVLTSFSQHNKDMAEHKNNIVSILPQSIKSGLVLAYNALKSDSAEVALTKEFQSTMIQEFNSKSNEINEMIQAECTEFIQELSLNKLITDESFSNAKKYVAKTYMSSEVLTFFTEMEVIQYWKKLCRVPELILEMTDNGDGSFGISLQEIKIPDQNKLFSNLTSATNKHFKTEIALLEGKKKEKSASTINDEEIKQSVYQNLQTQMALLQLLIGNINEEREAISGLFDRFKKKREGEKIDITNLIKFKEFTKTLTEKNNNLLSKTRETVNSEEYLSKTPFDLIALKKKSQIVDANLKQKIENDKLNEKSQDEYIKIIERQRREEEIKLHQKKTEQESKDKADEQYLQAWADTFSTYINVGAETTKNFVHKTSSYAGNLASGTVSSLLGGILSGVFGDWGTIGLIITMLSIPTLIGAYIALKMGGIRLMFRVGKMFCNIVFSPFKAVFYLFKWSGGKMVSLGSITMNTRQSPRIGPGNIQEVSSSSARRIEAAQLLRGTPPSSPQTPSPPALNAPPARLQIEGPPVAPPRTRRPGYASNLFRRNQPLPNPEGVENISPEGGRRNKKRKTRKYRRKNQRKTRKY